MSATLGKAYFGRQGSMGDPAIAHLGQCTSAGRSPFCPRLSSQPLPHTHQPVFRHGGEFSRRGKPLPMGFVGCCARRQGFLYMGHGQRNGTPVDRVARTAASNFAPTACVGHSARHKRWVPADYVLPRSSVRLPLAIPQRSSIGMQIASLTLRFVSGHLSTATQCGPFGTTPNPIRLYRHISPSRAGAGRLE